MKNQQTSEIIAILQEALDKIQEVLHSEEKEERRQERRDIKAEGDCEKCGTPLIKGPWGDYCKPCYLDRKESRRRR